MSTYDEVVREVAGDLGYGEAVLREAFTTYLATATSSRSPNLSQDLNCACYAVYRLTKQRDAFKLLQRSRERWRERAMELGSPGHLLPPRANIVNTDQGSS